VAAVGRFAVAQFWFGLADFAVSNPQPLWPAKTQPFFHLVEGRLAPSTRPDSLDDFPC